MGSISFHKLDRNRRTRQLASRERVGRFNRDRDWDQIGSFVGRTWGILLLLLLMPLVIAVPLSFLMKGMERWIFLGAFGISGPWLVVIFTILYSGVASSLMGLDGEHSTADILRKSRHYGWMLVNGVKIRRNVDIDHVMVGPAGILVVESKWSHNRWPVSDQNQSFMSRQLTSAVSQALWNRKLVQWRFGKDIEGVKVQAVCVLWSSADFSNDPPWIKSGEVIVVRGPALELWLKSLTEIALDEPGVEKIWKIIERQALSRDEQDLAYSGPPRPTLNRFIIRSILAPFLATFTGLMSALYGLLAISHFHPTWLIGGALVFLTIGIGALRISLLRKVALGWIASSAGVCLFWLVLVLRAHLH